MLAVEVERDEALEAEIAEFEAQLEVLFEDAECVEIRG